MRLRNCLRLARGWMAALLRGPFLFLAASLSLASNSAFAQADRPLDALSALALCQTVVEDFANARTLLEADGWQVPDLSPAVAEIYSEPDTGWYVRGEDFVMFHARHGGGLDGDGEKLGNCYSAFYGDSNISATEIAAHLDIPASEFRQNVRNTIDNFVFTLPDHNVFVASRTVRDEPARSSGITIVAVEPVTRQIEN